MNKGFSHGLIEVIVVLVFAVVGGGALWFTNMYDEIPEIALEFPPEPPVSRIQEENRI